MAPYDLESYGTADLHDVLAKLTVAEKISLLAGPDWWTTTSIPRVGVPHIKCSDGPNGVRGSSHFLPTPAQCIPCATALGATFDISLINEAGGLLARECKAKGSSLLLAPTCNIQRNPLNGRAFESFSEDPFLSGTIAAHYIIGLQNNGIGAVIKHFVCNDMEHERLSVDVRVGERALREIYLMPFMLAQKIAKPWAVMTSYSRVNGIHCSENHRLLQTILREEWGFDGMVMSDWSGTYSTSEAVNAGLDLEMPGPTRWRRDLINHLIHAGKISFDALSSRAYAILQVIQRAVRADPSLVKNNTLPERQLDSPDDITLNRRLAAESIVLLKNDLGVLPLDMKKIKKLAVIGPNAKTRTVSGGGSAFLLSSYVVTPLEGIEAALQGTNINVVYSPGCYAHRYLPMLDGWIKTADGTDGWTATFYNSDPDADTSPLSTYTLLSTRLRINDEKPKGLAEHFYIILRGYITAQESSPFELGISLVGRATMSLDGKLIVDNGMNRPQTPGDSFYGLGTIEETATVDLVKGKTYEILVKYTNTPLPVSSDQGEAKQPPLMMAALRVSGAPKLDPTTALDDAVTIACDADAVICVIGTNMDWEAEASDRKGLELPGLTDELVRRLLDANQNTIVVNQSGSAVAFPWVDKASTVVQAWFAGNECGNALADVIFGKVNPAGRLPLTFPKCIEDCTAHLNWGAESGRVTYGEGIFVGYRGYEETKRRPTFYFGHGLSYTTFEWSPLEVKLTGASTEISATAKLTVTNTGSLPGSDVVQLYVIDKVCSYRRPKRELKGFAKTEILSPGQSQELGITLDKMAFSFYNDARMAWVVEKGLFSICASRSANEADVMSVAEVLVDEDLIWSGI
ncbi:glycoside hydrolase family 3 protein [Desarmillaria tabescens]|uniref:beta-glucosidase n=1 Tax=Armillaria tabescens TaxID=1929756 RepID=A0AA39K6G1_ARMTA|nr:glycoside hydrolase family 3 protein [Desarmillaria tabescens]KAK0454089.1 glycoside hydrolase family 3 protein [Desarmillaria tabescens]